MTDKEQMFCEYYLQHFNKSKALEQAGYSAKNPYEQAKRLFDKSEIRNYIDQKLSMLREDGFRIAKKSDVLINLTKFLNGEIKETKHFKIGNKVITVECELNPSLRLKACHQLAMILGMYKNVESDDEELEFVD